MKKHILILFFLSAAARLQAQEVFIPRGKITFEKRVNMVRKMEDNNWLPDDYKDKMQKYQASNWDYTFTQSRSLFKAAKKEANQNSQFFFFSSEQTGQLYSDLEKGTRVMLKSVSDVDYILNDTIPKLEWKIQQDVRVIAGYECRKAIARFNDTVYAVAFYTDKILPKGGPEGFTGLPGMILGLAIPRYFTTWFATKVELLPEASLDLKIPDKGQRTDNEKDYKKMLDIYMRWRDDKEKPTEQQIRKDIYGLVL